MPRFVILLHHWPQCDRFKTDDHWDWMFESGGQLETWSTDIEPSLNQANFQLEAVKIPPHRLAYLTYEGPVSGDRGKVSQVLSGHYRPIEITKSNEPGDESHQDDPTDLFQRDRFTLRLSWQGGSSMAQFEKISGDRWTIRFCR